MFFSFSFGLIWIWMAAARSVIVCVRKRFPRFQNDSLYFLSNFTSCEYLLFLFRARAYIFDDALTQKLWFFFFLIKIKLSRFPTKRFERDWKHARDTNLSLLLFWTLFFFLLLPNHRKIFFLLLELCRNEYPSRKTSANEKWAAMIKNSSKDIRFLSFYFFVVPFSKPSTVINERLNNSSARFYIFSCDLVVVGYWLWLCWCCCLLFSLTCVSHAIVGTSAAGLL